ncbi:MAG: carboxypeptidase regulatory-like domain-containing protein, partial [Candidatus Magnetomorum sp.]|nr:carboxypeptidase regulatory-like domain-containing protein [Candidatus Magnetomorum sp.]
EAGVRVEAWSNTTGVYGSAITRDIFENNANYSITGLSPGIYQIGIKTSAFTDQELEITLSNVDLSYIDFVLQKPEHLISGTLMGLNINEDVYINARANSINYNQTIKITGTGETQAYTLNDLKPAQDYIVELFHPNQYIVYNQKNHISDADKLNVYGHMSGIDFTLTPGNEIISGTLTFPESAQSGEKAWVDAFSNNTGSQGSATVLFNTERTVPFEIKALQATDDFLLLAYSDRYPEQFYPFKSDREHADLINTSDAIVDNAIHFQLNCGASISGQIYADGHPFEGAIVSAFSQKTGSWGGSQTSSDGTYIIEGIDSADDFIVKVSRTSDSTPFYYHHTATTRDQSTATLISTVIENQQTGIDLELSNFESIGGVVRDHENKPLSGIWLSAWSKIQQSGYGTFTKSDGSYLIEDLPKSSDYSISVEPDAILPYIPQSKISVASNNLGVNFILYSGWKISGQVSDIKGQGIDGAGIELKSTLQKQNRWVETDPGGKFSINGLVTSQDYMLSIISPTNGSYLPYYESDLVIDQNINKSITLQSGYAIKGHVYKDDGITPIASIPITAFSSSLNYMGRTESDATGYYEITPLPQATDYVLTAHAKDYAKDKQHAISTGSVHNFNLQAGGKINGYVRTEAGDPIKNVRVEVQSLSLQLVMVSTTLENGSYLIQGLKKFHENGSMINDYFTNIYPAGYISQTHGPMRVGESANFICIKGKENEISGKVLDNAGQPFTGDITLVVKAYKNTLSGGYVTKAQAGPDGSFKLEGLSPNEAYFLRVIAIQNNNIIKDQWAGVDDIGGVERNESKEYRTLGTEAVGFRFGE